MDVSSIATAYAFSQASQRSTAIAQVVLKQNAEAGQAVADLLEASAQSLKALTADGVGGMLDVTV